MRALWRTVIAPLLDSHRPATIVEVCTGGDGLGHLLEEAASTVGGTVLRELPDTGSARPDMAILSGQEATGAVRELLQQLGRAAGRAPYPLTVVHGVDAPAARDEVLMAIEDLLEERGEELRLVHVPGLGGTAILIPARRLEGEDSQGLRDLLDGWRLSGQALAQMATIDGERLRAEALVVKLSDELAALRFGGAMQESAERAALRRRVAGLAAREAELIETVARRETRVASLEAAAATPTIVPPPAPKARVAAAPRVSLADTPAEPDLVDRRGILAEPHAAALGVVVHMGGELEAVRRCLWSLLSRSDRSLALTLLAGDDTERRVRRLAEAFVAANPAAAIASRAGNRATHERTLVLKAPVTFGHLAIRELLDDADRNGASVITGHDDVPQDRVTVLNEEGKLRESLSIGYLVPNLPADGSRGSSAAVQEARALAGLGAKVSVLVDRAHADRVEALHPGARGLFDIYRTRAERDAALESLDVIVATEPRSAREVAAHVHGRRDVLGAYYLQDHEPLLPVHGDAQGSPVLDDQADGLLLFATTHWIARAVGAIHGLPVAKVRPCLDDATFHAAGRSRPAPRARVAALLRPATPRRRAAETVSALRRLGEELGGNVECLTFGCTAADRSALGSAPGVDHLGVLTRAEVGEVLRRCDLFLDLSSYLPVGQTGLEAMACGAVPLLPARGGITEHAKHARNALLVDTEDEGAAVAAAAALLTDRRRLERLRARGQETAAAFSARDGAVSRAACFLANLPGRRVVA